VTGRHDRDQRTENPVVCGSYGSAPTIENQADRRVGARSPRPSPSLSVMLSIGVTAGPAFRRSGAPGLPDATVGRWPGLLLTEDSPVAADLFSPRAQLEVAAGVRRRLGNWTTGCAQPRQSCRRLQAHPAGVGSAARPGPREDYLNAMPSRDWSPVSR